MTTKEAVNVLKPEGNTEADLKKAYREAAKKYHPDLVGEIGLKMMQAINQAYETLRKADHWTCEEATNEDILDVILNLWNKISTLPGIEGEICGTWLWISGDTRTYKNKLKSFKCKWAPKKKLWYWRPESYKKTKRSRPCTMDTIRKNYGSVDLESTTSAQVGI